MSTFQQALEAYGGGQVDLAALRRVMLEELARVPDRYESLRREIVRACQRRRVAPTDLEELLEAFDDGKTRIATVHSVALDADDATLFDDAATVYAGTQAIGSARADQTQQTALPTQLADSSTGAEAATVPGADGQPLLVTVPEPTQPPGTPSAAGELGQLKPGDVLNDQFELEEAIGEGGMGVIFRAKDTLDLQFSNSNPYVAVKVLSESFSDHKDSVMALHRETRNARSLRHDNIIRVDTFARDACTGQYFMVMEYLRGEPLNHTMQRQTGQGLSFDKVWRICEGAGEGLKHAHAKGIIHSDIKPSNMWLTESGNVKVLDFGIARVAKPDTQTVWEGLAALSVPYATQEMLRRQEPDERDDVYALACVTYELLTGHHPYQKIDAIQAESEGITPARPRGLKAHQWRTLRQALCLQRDQRTPSIAAFLDGMRPRPVRWLPVSAAVVVVSAVLGLVTAYQGGMVKLDTAPDQEQRFLEKLLATEIDANHMLDDEDLPLFLENGHQSLEDGRAFFATDEFQPGNQVLKNGPSVALRDFYDVLRGSDNQERRLAAAKGILAIHLLYASTVDRVQAEGAAATALWLSCQSLAQTPGARVPELPRLRAQYETLWREKNGAAAPPIEEGCNSNEVQDVWGRELTFRSPTRGWRVPDRTRKPANPPQEGVVP